MLRSFTQNCLMLVALHAAGVSALAQELVSSPPASETAPDFINSLLQRGWISLDAEGKLHGKVNALDSEGELQGSSNVDVALLLDGKSISQATTDAAGAFTLSGVTPGTYALVAKSKTIFTTSAVHVLASGEHLQAALTVYASAISEQRTRELVQEHWVPEADSTLNYYRVHEHDPLSTNRKFNDSHRVRLQNGNLVGRVSRPGWLYSDQDLSGTVAHVLKNGVVVGTAAVAKDGYFTVAGIQPGVYDLFVGGEDGIAVVGFQALSTETSAKKGANGLLFVDSQAGFSDVLCCEMVHPIEIASPAAPGEMVTDPMGGGFASSGGGLGGGGGGGGGLGGGGMGGLLGIAGLAVGVAALSEEDAFDPGLATLIAP